MEVFNGIQKNRSFYENIRTNFGLLRRAFYRLHNKYEEKDLQKAYKALRGSTKVVMKSVSRLKEYKTGTIVWEKIEAEADKALKDSSELKNKIYAIQRDEKEAGKSTPYNEKYNSELNDISRLERQLWFYKDRATSKQAQLSNNPKLLLEGSAGIGKTHLLCDVVKGGFEDTKNNRPAILLFGHKFRSSADFWDQLIKEIDYRGKKRNKSHILNLLNEAGKKRGARSLIIIDALNETQSKTFWKKGLSPIIKTISRYPHIGVVLSMRNGYRERIMPKRLLKQFVTLEHRGFTEDVLWDAVTYFFDKYNIKHSEIPLLHPEFYNPLFLKFFCKKYKNSKFDVRGGDAFTDLFEDFVIEEGLEILKHFDKKAKKRKNGKNIIWDNTLKEIANWMAIKGRTLIPENEILKIISSIPDMSDKKAKKFLDLMEKRTLISKVEYDEGPEYYFTYNKFSDHLIVRYLLRSVEPKDKRKRSFHKNGKIGKTIKKLKYDTGILEALCVQTPEFCGEEIFKLAPYLLKEHYYSFDSAYKESLIWRKQNTITPAVKNIIAKNIIKKSPFFLDPVISLSAFPKHPLNADFLHGLLMDMPMPERDANWSTYLHEENTTEGAVHRMIKWAWSDQKRDHISDDSIMLACTVLAWMLSTPNRYLRDKATKGLVCLLENRLHLVTKLLEKFAKVDDPYITERLYAVAYGCSLRNSKDRKGLKALAIWVYDKIFKSGKPVPHITTRDNARGIIEIALQRKMKLGIKKKLIRPPYKSNFPKIPTHKSLEKYDWMKSATKKRNDYSTIWASIMYDSFGGDFGKYVINPNVERWREKTLKDFTPSRQQILDNFVKGLSKKQRELWGQKSPFYGLNLAKILLEVKNEGKKMSVEEEAEFNEEYSEEKEKKRYDEAIKKFLGSLSKKKLAYYKKEIEPYLDDRGGIANRQETFDTAEAQRWIFKRVIDLGWSPTLHQKFDGLVNRSYNRDRFEDKPERIGKKYQWIALQEFLAYLSDNYRFKGQIWGDDRDYDYNGTWDISIRDNDPSITIKDDSHLKAIPYYKTWKNVLKLYDPHSRRMKDATWIKKENDLPHPKGIICAKDSNNEEWLLLQGMVDWDAEYEPEEEKYENPRRRLWYMVKSYIVHKKDLKKLYNWMKRQNFGGNGIELSDFYDCYLGEYPNSECFDDIRRDHNTWVDGTYRKKMPAKVTVTTDRYIHEFRASCAYESTFSLNLPSKWLINNMGLKNKNLDGIFYDQKDEITIFPTAIFTDDTVSAIFANKKKLCEFLKKNDYAIIWSLLGEKNMIGGRMAGPSSLGWLVANGGFTLSEKNNIIGSMSAKYEITRTRKNK